MQLYAYQSKPKFRPIIKMISVKYAILLFRISDFGLPKLIINPAT
jgi:hypothetical protein